MDSIGEFPFADCTRMRPTHTATLECPPPVHFVRPGMMMMPGGIIGAPLMGGVQHLGPVMSMSTAPVK